MGCKNVCSKFSQKKVLVDGKWENYSPTRHFCRTCDKYVKPINNYCPCCNMKTRGRPRGTIPRAHIKFPRVDL